MNVLPKYWGVISSLTSTVHGAWVYGFKNRINRHTHKQGSPTAGRPLPLYTTGVQVPCTRGLGELFGRVLLLRVVEQPDWSMVMTLMINGSLGKLVINKPDIVFSPGKQTMNLLGKGR